MFVCYTQLRLFRCSLSLVMAVLTDEATMKTSVRKSIRGYKTIVVVYNRQLDHWATAYLVIEIENITFSID